MFSSYFVILSKLFTSVVSRTNYWNLYDTYIYNYIYGIIVLYFVITYNVKFKFSNKNR